MANKTIRDLTADEVTFTLTVEQDDIPVRGNAIASGEDAFDKKVEDEILARLDQGDVWAWGCVSVTAEWNGWKGVTHLGACSYEDEDDFKKDNYEQMKGEALDDLNASLQRNATTLATLKVGT